MIQPDSDNENDVRFQKYSGKTQDFLKHMFGEDATTKSDKSPSGIVLDETQIDVLKDSWRCDKPYKISAFKDSYRSSFPISDSAEEILCVPSLDSIITSMLMKRFSSKATVKSQQLFSTPLRDIEKLAYQGQHAARMGIIINLYMQQALGNLLKGLTEKEPNIDAAVQCVRDIFAMNTKSLDQAGRAGAIHHLVRRKAAMADSGLNDSKDVRNQIWNLPLSHEGIFGSGLEQKLKERVEMNKQISDLLPEMDRKRHRSHDRFNAKRTRFADDSTQSFKSSGQSYSGTSRQPYRSSSNRGSYQRFSRNNTSKSATRFYIVGSNQKETEFRVLKIDRTEMKDLHIQDDKRVYNTVEIRNLLTMLESGNRMPKNQKSQTGLTKTVSAYGIAGFVKFLEGYYMILITKRRKIALIGGHTLYKIEDTNMIYIPNTPPVHPDEHRYSKIFQSVDLSSNFYFSFSYDLTHTLQYNMAPTRFSDIPQHGNMEDEQNEALGQRDKTKSSSTVYGVRMKPARKFVWNNHLLKNFETLVENKIGSDEQNEALGQTYKRKTSSTVYGVRMKPARKFVWNNHLLKNFETLVEEDWVLYVIYGFIQQSNLCVYGKPIYITLIARRSNQFAGTRFLKRGVSSEGAVANEVETEQIVHDASLTCLEKTRVSSFVQMRGSIPVYWSQDISKMVPKPPIAIDQRDPYFNMAGLHFNQCLRRYGAPIILLNLIKRREKRPQESILCDEFKNCKAFLNQFLPPDKNILYIGFDMAHYTKSKSNSVLDRLAKISRNCVKQSGFFFNYTNLKPDFWEQDQFEGVLGYKTKTGCRQTGVVRTNCVDCLDRTNTAQFAVSKCALAYQLCALGVLDSPDLAFDTDCLKVLEELYEDQGDTIALQYGGSQLVHRIEGYRKIAPWKSHSRDVLQTISRYYSNTFSDLEKQQATNVFLGLFTPNEREPNIWDLPTDFYLHNRGAMGKIISRRSYTNWCEPCVFNYLPLPYDEEQKKEDCERVVKTDLSKEEVNMLDEYYMPFEFTQLDELYCSTMAHSYSFVPKNTPTYSPFKRRATPEAPRENRFATFARHGSEMHLFLRSLSSHELNPNISGKDSTASQQSNTSEEGSTSSVSSVEGDMDVTSSTDESNEDADFPNNRSHDLEDNPYNLELTRFQDDGSTQEIYKKYVDFTVLCEKPPKVKIGLDLEDEVFLEPTEEYKSDMYSVEQPTVSHRSTEIYQKYVKCGLEGASEPADANKEIYRNYIRQLYR